MQDDDELSEEEQQGVDHRQDEIALAAKTKWRSSTTLSPASSTCRTASLACGVPARGRRPAWAERHRAVDGVGDDQHAGEAHVERSYETGQRRLRLPGRVAVDRRECAQAAAALRPRRRSPWLTARRLCALVRTFGDCRRRPPCPRRCARQRLVSRRRPDSVASPHYSALPLQRSGQSLSGGRGALRVPAANGRLVSSVRTHTTRP